MLEINGGRLEVTSDSTVKDNALEVDEPDIEEKDLKTLLYNVEPLRKQDVAAAKVDDGDGDVAQLKAELDQAKEEAGLEGV